MALLKFKRSAVSGKAPTLSDLELGELAINTFDGKVYMRKDNGTASIIEVGGGSGVLSFNTRTGAVTLSSGDVTTALGYTPANKAGDTFTGTVTIPDLIVSDAQPTFSNSSFQYHWHQSPHIAYVKKTGGYSWYWRRNDTGTLSGANEVEDMSLTEDGNLLVRSSVRAPIFYDSNDTTYYIDPNTTATSFRGRGEIFLGPNASSQYLRIGGNGGQSDHCTVSTSNGNLHIDSKAGNDLYLNWYSARPVWSEGGAYFPIYYDRNDTSAYVDPAGASWIKGGFQMNVASPSNDVFGGLEMREAGLVGAAQSAATYAPGINFHWGSRAAARLYMDASGNFVLGAQGNITSGRRSLYVATLDAAADARAPIFYDSNNTAYYLDPASTGISGMINGEMRFGGGGSSSVITSDGDFYSRRKSSTSTGVYYFADGGQKYHYWDGTRYYYGNAGPTDTDVSFRAPIFYDLNNTGYYVDPNSTSNIYRLASYTAAQYNSGDWTAAFQNTPTQSYAWHGDISSGGPSGTWWFYESMRHSNASNYWGTQVAWGWEDNSNRLMQRNVSGNSFSAWVEYLSTGGRTYNGNLTMTGSIISSSSDVRAPIFYDQNDTGYYVDPNGNTRVRNLNLGGGSGFDATIHIVGIQGGNGRLTQMSPNGASQAGFNILSARNGSNADLWWSWGVNTDNTWRCNAGVGYNGSAGFTLDASGNFTAGGNVTAYSDARLKKDVETIGDALGLVRKMRGVTYTRIDTDKAGIGVIAQEMLEVVPEVVQHGTGDDDTLSVAYGNLVGVLIEAIKELTNKVETLEAHIRSK